MRAGFFLVFIASASVVQAQTSSPESPKPIIPVGREGFIKNMLTPPAGSPCKGTAYDVDKDHIVADYECATQKGTVHSAIELHHPSVDVKSIARTKQFVISAKSGVPVPPRPFVEQLVAQVQTAEASWTWATSKPPQPAADKPGSAAGVKGPNPSPTTAPKKEK